MKRKMTETEKLQLRTWRPTVILYYPNRSIVYFKVSRKAFFALSKKLFTNHRRTKKGPFSL